VNTNVALSKILVVLVVVVVKVNVDLAVQVFVEVAVIDCSVVVLGVGLDYYQQMICLLR